MRWLVATLMLVGCGEDDRVPVSGRCAERTDLLVRDADPTGFPDGTPLAWPPWPSNTEGDERLELWFFAPSPGADHVAMEGYAPRAEGYERVWHFARPGALASFHLDFNGDGYADLLTRPRDDEPNGAASYSYYETQPDGRIGEVAITVPTFAGEGEPRWRHIDNDGILDRVVTLGGALVWISGADQTIHDIGLSAAEPAVFFPVPGDSRLWGFAATDPGPYQLIRITDAGHDLVWQSSRRRLGGGTAVHGDHIDVLERPPSGTVSPADIVLIRLDPSGRWLDERRLAEATSGMLLYDYDGDGHRDLIFEAAGRLRIRFGAEDDEYTDPEPLPAFLEEDLGIMQSFDLDGDGAMQLLVAFAEPDGRVRWQGLGWGQCP